MINTQSFFDLQNHALEQSHGLYDIYSVLARRAYLDRFEGPLKQSSYHAARFYQSVNDDYLRLSEEFDRLRPYSPDCVGLDVNWRAAMKPYTQMEGRIGNMYGKDTKKEVLLHPEQCALDALTEFLSAIADELESQLGYHWQVLQAHFKQTFQGREIHWHTDMNHPAIVKLLVFLDGASEADGTTKFIAVDGSEKQAQGPKGTWLLLDVNSLRHSVVAPTASPVRRTLEITLGPAIKTDPIAKGVEKWNALYPFVPWALESTHQDDLIVQSFLQRHDKHFERQINHTSALENLLSKN